MKLKWKISLSVFALLILSTLATTIMSYTMTKNSVDQIVDGIVQSNLGTLVNMVLHAENTERAVIDEMGKRNLALTRTFADVIAHGRTGGTIDLDDVAFFQAAAKRMGVAEINVVDDKGDIVGSNFEDYYGWNYSSSASTIMYLEIINNPSYEIVEGIRADAISGDMIQYLGVARRDEKGFVQLGFDANVVQEFRKNLDISATVMDMQVGKTGHAAVIRDGIVENSRRAGMVGENVSSSGWYRQVSSGKGMAWLEVAGENVYTGYANVGDLTLLVFFPRAEYNGYLSSVTIAAIVSVVLAVLIAFVTYLLVSYMLKPLIPLTAYMLKASSTGDIVMQREDVETISRLATIKDELGQCVSACAAFVGRVTDVSKTLETVADGDLSAEIDPLSDKDTLGISLRKMSDMLNTMFKEIQYSSERVSSGAKQLANGSQNLAQGSTEQASSIDELSKSIADIARKTKENADTAGKTAQLADTIRSNAERGSLQMDEMIDAVKRINQSSQNISKVIKVIDDIAFQTNILALNAAVEAARAGQHGKGFAVVAEEVRNLASKSAEAAKDTGVMIQDSMDKAELGARIAEETAASLTEIVAGINESTILITEIAQSSEEQSTGITSINTGIDQVAQVVQQNSATAEESAAASIEMSSQSNLLQELISQMRLKDDQQVRSLPPSRRK